jgi:type IV secretory pathway VirB6-like protein
MMHNLRKLSPALRLLSLTVAMLWVGSILLSSSAYATGLNECAPGIDFDKITQRVVSCIERATTQAVFSMMGQVQAYMAPVAGALMALAVAVAGIRVVSGEKPGRSIMYAVRLAMVAYFYNNLGTFAGTAFQIEGELIGIVSGGSPWVMIDNFMKNLIGYGPELMMFQGILAIIGAAAFASYSVGFMLFMAGMSAIASLLLFIFNVVYTYCASIIMLGFLIVLSPLFVPYAVFFLTERYLKKLIDMIVSVMLMPVLLFAFINMFLGIFDALISDLFNSVLPENRDFRALWNLNNPVFSWLMPSDTSLMNRLEGVAEPSPTAANPAVQTTVNQFLRHGFNAGSVGNLPGLNFGPSEPVWVQQIGMKLITLWLFATLMKSLVSRIPQISSAIAGSVIGVPLSATDPGQVLKNVQENLRIGGSALFGGAAGSALGGGAAKLAGGNAMDQRLASQGGGILGAMAGMMITKR